MPNSKSALKSRPETGRSPGAAHFRTYRLTLPPVSGVFRPRLVGLCAGLAAATFLLFCWGLTTGDYPIDFTDVVRALVNSGDPGTVLVVQELRLPRALVGLLAGIAFGVSGALFQTMTRNPLASPDMIGLTQGAGTAVVAGIVLGWDGAWAPRASDCSAPWPRP